MRAGQAGADDVYYLDDSIPWKAYIATHTECDKIVGTGIIAAHIERIHHTQDANRGNKARVDYVFYRSDITFCRVHPGTTHKSDAKLYCADNSICGRAVHLYDVAPNPMTFEAAMQIPMQDRMGKAEAWQQLSQRDDALTDVTEHGNFKWWLFFSSFGGNRKKVFGSGITSVEIHKRGKIFGLRAEDTQGSVQWVIVTNRATRLAASFE